MRNIKPKAGIRSIVKEDELLSLDKEYLKKIYEIIHERYERELKIEEDLIIQASHMQTSFSFVTAAIFMVAPLAFEYRGRISVACLFIQLSVVSLLILTSLLMATIAFDRKKHQENDNADNLLRFFLDNKCLEKNKIRMVSLIYQYGDLQISLANNNEKRIKFLRLSIKFLYATIASIVCCFIGSVLIA